MKVLHVPFCFHPDAVGGTEIYVESLALWQRRQGMEVEVAAPAAKERSYIHGGLDVHRFATGAPDLRDFYGEGDGEAAASFGRIVERSAPDVVHLHAWTSGVSLRLARASKNLGVPVVFTYHTPTVSCVRGTLLRWGAEICEGNLETAPCAACMLEGKGVNLAVSRVLGGIPPAVGERIGKAGLAGGVWTALRASELIELRRGAFRALLSEADHLVAVCEWVRDLLLRNHADPAKLTLSRQGLREPVQSMEPRPRNRNGEIRIAFLGRVSPVKGIGILLDAMGRVSDARLKLDVYGVVQDEEGRRLLETFSRRRPADRRIRFLPAVAAGDVVPALAAYDLLAVPSQWLETGPLVVYEAFAAGVPVLGSRLGGIAELVEHQRNGLLVEPASTEAWARALRRLLEEPGLLARLRSGVPLVRNMRTAAEEMEAIYAGLPRPEWDRKTCLKS